MKGTVHAFEYLDSPVKLSEGSVCVLFGNQRFLATTVLQRMIDAAGGDVCSVRLDPDSMLWADFVDELGMRSLFGGDSPKIVILDGADDFVSARRDELEKYLTNSKRVGALVLIVETWGATTRLYKLIHETGLQIHCDLPQITRGRSKYTDDAKIGDWLVARAKKSHGFRLRPDGAAMLRDLCNYDLGRMDQELAKLALFVQPDAEANSELVHRVVGGWREETMWTAIDAALDGDAAKSLGMLDKMFRNHERALALFGQLSWSLRRFVAAHRLIENARASGKKVQTYEAIANAGFSNWQGEREKAELRMERIGRKRLARLADWLLRSDLMLKRSHSTEDRGRLVVERLIVWLGDLKTGKNTRRQST